MRWLLAALLGVVVSGLVFANLAVFGVLAWEKSNVSSTSDLSCELPGNDSTYTPSEWRWFPPGRACVFGGRAFDEPSWLSGVAVILFPIALAGSVVALSAQTRRALDASRDAESARLVSG
jgi:hypothetical protein